MGEPISSQVIWSYAVAGVVLVAGLASMFLRGDWQRARGIDKLIRLGPIFFAVPLAAFGTEHFTLTEIIASIIPAWIPWHMFWAYALGGCFIVAALSLVTGIGARLAATMLALNFFLFFALMDVPGLAEDPKDRFAAAVTLRELSFSGGAMALAVSLAGPARTQAARFFSHVARYFVAVPVVFYSVEQFLHGDHVPGIPLKRVTPDYVIGHGVWTYVTAAAYAVAVVPLLLGKKTRAAATAIGLTVLLVELVVYVPIGIVEVASLGNGLNYVMDTLMYCGAVFLLAGAMPREP